MNQTVKFFIVFIFTIVVDQIIKYLFTHGAGVEGKCISLVLAYNKGVAFSMFAFLGEYLKYIQVALIFAVVGYLISKKDILKEYAVPAGLILAGGISNIADRFFREGVVDYVYWHCGFDFAIFNYADVMIDLGVLLILIKSFKK